MLATASLLAEHGFFVDAALRFWLQAADATLAGVYIADRVLMLARVSTRWEAVRRRRFEFAVLGLFLVSVAGATVSSASVSRFLGSFQHDDPGLLVFRLLKLFLLANVLVQLLRLQQRLLSRRIRPEWMLAGSYAMLILAGTLLLSLPRASARPDQPVELKEAFFTATSASCVTGFVLRDTGTGFSTFGQTVLLVLFQVGGLGIMTFVAFLAVTSSESLPVPQMLAFRQLIGARTPALLQRQLWAIFVFTLVVEGAGAVCLYVCLPAGGDILARLGWSVFHSVSAFCNAGFALSAESLIPFRTHTGATLTFLVLIVLGSLGFLVVTDLVGLQVSRLPLIRSIPWVRRYNQAVPVRRFPIQTRLSLLMTVILVVAGVAGFWVLEAGHALSGEPVGNQLRISALQSVTTRSAGFNAVPTEQLQPATMLFIMSLMVIGACPVSAGGGIKTVTFAVLLLALRSMITGRERLEIYGRALPQRVLLASLAVSVLYVMVAALGLFGLVLCDPHLPLRSLMFETVSALSTCGLTTGITPRLSVPSQLILCVLMFIGRVGPISLLLSIVQMERSTRYQYPEEDLLVG